MKRYVLLAATAFTMTVAEAQEKSVIQSLPIGSSIPMGDRQFVGTETKGVTLDNTKTKNGLLVMFSCNTCPYVIKSQQRTKEMIKYAEEHGIGMVIVNSNEAQRGEEDSFEAMKAYAKKQGYTASYVMDEKSALADAFGATRTPEVYLFDGNGKLVYKGAMEDNPSNPAESKQIFLKTAIDNMLAGSTIDPNSTKSIGCSIKRVM